MRALVTGWLMRNRYGKTKHLQVQLTSLHELGYEPFPRLAEVQNGANECNLKLFFWTVYFVAIHTKTSVDSLPTQNEMQPCNVTQTSSYSTSCHNLSFAEWKRIGKIPLVVNVIEKWGLIFLESHGILKAIKKILGYHL